MTGQAAVGLRAAMAGEWVKLRTVRSTAWAPAVIVLVTLGGTLLVGLTESLEPGDTVLGGTANGAVLGMLAAGLLGATAMSNEYREGTIRATFGACPRRLTVLGGKVVVVAALAFAVALVACAGALLTGLATLHGKGYGTGDPLPSLFGMAACFAAVALLGLAAATILRHPATAATTVVGIVLLPSLLGPLFGAGQRWVTALSPMTALEKLAHPGAAAGGAGPWQSLGLVGACTLIALAGAAWSLHRRDA